MCRILPERFQVWRPTSALPKVVRKMVPSVRAGCGVASDMPHVLLNHLDPYRNPSRTLTGGCARLGAKQIRGPHAPYGNAVQGSTFTMQHPGGAVTGSRGPFVFLLPQLSGTVVVYPDPT